MAWQHSLMATGLTGDGTLEANGVLLPDITLSSGKIQFPTGTNNKKCLVKMPGHANWGSGIIAVISAWITTPASAPSSAIGLVTDGTQGATQRWVRLDTDMKVKFYDKNGNLLASSTTALSTSTEYELVMTFDSFTLSTVWISLWLGTAGGTMTEEIAANTGLSAANFAGVSDLEYFGDWTPSGSNYGQAFQARYIIRRDTGTAGDSPHLTAYPRLVGYGGDPVTGSGALVEYANGDTPGANSYQDVDETGTFDTARWATIGQEAGPYRQLATHSTTNTLSSSSVIVNAQWRWLAKLDAAGKQQGTGLLRLSGTNYAAGVSAGNGSDTTNYSARGSRLNQNPATAAAWVYTDWDLSGGVSKWSFGVTCNGDATSKSGDEIALIKGLEAIYSTANLSLATTPSAGISKLITETINISKLPIKLFARSILEAGQIIEKPTKLFIRPISEIVNITKSINRFFGISQPEVTNISESPSKFWIRHYAETMNLFEFNSKLFSLSTSEVEQISDFSSKFFRHLVTEIIQISELYNNSFLHLFGESEQIVESSVKKVTSIGQQIIKLSAETMDILERITKLFVSRISEQENISELRNGIFKLSRSVSEIEQIIESLSPKVLLTRLLGEIEQLAELTSRPIGYIRHIAEIEPITDNIVKTIGGQFIKVVSEVVNIAEFIGKLFIRRVSETEQIKEYTIYPFILFVWLISDIESIAENILARSSVLKLMSEIVQISESTRKLFSRSFIEAEQIAEIISRALKLIRLLSESEQIIEFIRRIFSRGISETEQITENHTKLWAKVFLELEQIQESSTKLFAKLFTEVLQIGENTAKSFNRMVGETENISEFGARTLSYVRSILETERITEFSLRIISSVGSIVKVWVETVDIAENIKRAIRFVRPISEAVDVTELSWKLFTRLQTEIEQIIETPTKLFSRSNLESIQITELSTKLFSRLIREAVNISESGSRAIRFVRSIVDIEQIIESPLQVIVSAGQIIKVWIETINIAELARRNISYIRSLSEVVDVLETLRKPLALQRYINENEQISVNLSKLFIHLQLEIEQIVESISKLFAKLSSENESIVEIIVRPLTIKIITSEIVNIIEGLVKSGVVLPVKIINEVVRIVEISNIAMRPFILQNLSLLVGSIRSISIIHFTSISIQLPKYLTIHYYKTIADIKNVVRNLLVEK